MESNIIQKIENIFADDNYQIGFADLNGLLNPPLNKYSYAISILCKLEDDIIDLIANGPTLDYFNLYNNVNSELNSKTDEIVSLLHSEGIEAKAVKATVKDSELDDEYRKSLRYFFSHKMAATRAGLGWIGKTDLLISHRFGPRVRLATVLTADKISEPGTPVIESQCGNCTLCVDNCPAHAANGTVWNSAVDRDLFYDPFKCRDFARKISTNKIEKEISLCGICVSVCPYGKK